jgi:hypothetical protein
MVPDFSRAVSRFSSDSPCTWPATSLLVLQRAPAAVRVLSTKAVPARLVHAALLHLHFGHLQTTRNSQLMNNALSNGPFWTRWKKHCGNSIWNTGEWQYCTRQRLMNTYPVPHLALMHQTLFSDPSLAVTTRQRVTWLPSDRLPGNSSSPRLGTFKCCLRVSVAQTSSTVVTCVVLAGIGAREELKA